MITRAEWQAEKAARDLEMGTWGFDPLMPWHVANWHERLGIMFFYAVGWGVVFPAMLIGGLWLLGSIGVGVGRYNEEHDRCLKNATNGYEIRECR